GGPGSGSARDETGEPTHARGKPIAHYPASLRRPLPATRVPTDVTIGRQGEWVFTPSAGFPAHPAQPTLSLVVAAGGGGRPGRLVTYRLRQSLVCPPGLRHSPPFYSGGGDD